MTPEQLELAITHYLDGTLPPEDVAALEPALDADPLAQAILHDHRQLTALLRAEPLPEMDWAELARDLSTVVTGHVDESSRADDQKLNAILRSASPLPAVRWDEFAARVSASIDAEIAATSAEDEELDGLLRSAPMPAVNWDRLATHLSGAIAAEAADQAPAPLKLHTEEARPAVAGRIGFARTFRRMAVAACVLVATAVGIRSTMNRGGEGSNPTNPTGPVAVVDTKPKAVIQIEAPTVELASKPAVAEISIGPSKSYAANTAAQDYRHGADHSAIVIALPVRAEEEADHSFGFD